MTTDEFVLAVQEWITSAKHPETGRLYTEMVYQPMVETAHLSAQQWFQNFHRSAAVEFMRGGRSGSMESRRSR